MGNDRIRLIAALFLVSILVAGRSYAAGDGDPAVAAIDAAIASLKKEPNQFNLTVMNVGVMGSGSGGGVGINANPQGGGPGSTTIGVQGTANGGNVTIAKAAADEQLKAEAAKAVRLLEEIRGELVKKKPDAPTVKSRFAEFAKTYVPDVVKAVIGALLKRYGL